jgi:DNA topoisomerase IA
MYFTSVTGHLMNMKFKEENKNWRGDDPLIYLKQVEVSRKKNK